MNNKNETPFANPRFLVVLGITFVFLWGWQTYMAKQYPAATKQQEIATTAASSPQAVSEAKEAVEAKLEAAPVLETKTYAYSDDLVDFTVNSKGFGFSDFKIKSYKGKDGQPLSFTKPEYDFFALFHKGKAIPFAITVSSDQLTYTGEATVEGAKITRVLSYNKEKQFFNSSIKIDGALEQFDIIVQEPKLVSDRNSVFLPSFDHQDFIYVDGGKTHSDRISTIKDGEGFSKTVSNVTLASVGTQYFVSAMANKSDINPEVHNKLEKNLASFVAHYNLQNSKVSELNQLFYVGAKKTEVLENIDPVMPELLNYGIFGFIARTLLLMLKFIHQYVGNWGFAIIILTLIVRSLMLPLNVTSFKSAQAMQRIKPQMDAIRERYKSDPMRMNKETMALMKQNNANPLTGCFPMLLQIPIFFAFFAMISTSVELYQQPFIGWLTDLSAHDKFFVLPILMGITMYFQQKLTPTTMDPTQAKILAFMPIIFTLFMLTLPSGLTLYNFVSALFGVAQQYYMLKHKAKTA